MKTTPEGDIIVCEQRYEVRAFVNENGGITLTQASQFGEEFGEDLSTIWISVGDVTPLIRALNTLRKEAKANLG